MPFGWPSPGSGQGCPAPLASIAFFLAQSTQLSKPETASSFRSGAWPPSSVPSSLRADPSQWSPSDLCPGPSFKPVVLPAAKEILNFKSDHVLLLHKALRAPNTLLSEVCLYSASSLHHPTHFPDDSKQLCHLCLQLSWPMIPPSLILMDPKQPVFILHNLVHGSPLEFSRDLYTLSKNWLLHPYGAPK